MTTPDIIFYTAKASPFAQRVGRDRVPRSESRRDQVLDRRSEQARMVPALVYGSPKSDPENPSPGSAKIAESLVLLEFVADLYPTRPCSRKTPSSALASGSSLTR
ncbi:hypothetical protein EDB87DRAFT_1582053, partial [Lactarius vividus]